MSCALWLHNYGLRPVIVEREAELGGLARFNAYPNDWLLGRPAESGRENAAAFTRHIREIGVEALLDTRPRRLSNANGGFRLELASSASGGVQPLSAPALVVATGTRFDGEDWLERIGDARELIGGGRVHLGPTYAGEPGADLGARVAVLGGGDNAFDVSRMLAERGLRVTLIMRSAAPRARQPLVDRLREHEASGAVSIMAARTVERLEGGRDGIHIRLDGGASIEADHVLILFGYRPNTDEPWLTRLGLERDARGYLTVDGNMETSRRGVFAVGDVANPANPCVVTALASGAMAAREIERRLAAR